MAIPKRFSGPELIGTAVTTFYTVPAQRRSVLRHIHVRNSTNDVHFFSFSILLMSTDTAIFENYPIAPNSVFDHYPFYVLEEGDLYQASADADAVLQLTVNGEEDLTA